MTKAWHLEGKTKFESNRANVVLPDQLTELQMTLNKNVMNGNADKNGQSTGSDDDDSGEATENTCENLVNASQNNVTLSFENVEEISDEEKIIN